MKYLRTLCLLSAMLIVVVGCATTQSKLMRAAAAGKTNTVTALIDEGANVNAKNNEGDTARMLASRFGHTETAKALLAAGAD
ncbi:MAG: ankyrin repeat domain-containing protein [Gammaproteobacteria bacterium]|jgi:ankyrin repeat protein